MKDLIEESRTVLGLLFKVKMKVRNSSSMSLEEKNTCICNLEKEEMKFKKLIYKIENHESIYESANDAVAR